MIPKIIIRFKGGLGNQMFIYAFYCALKQKNPHAIFLFDTYNSRHQHQGFELLRIFPIQNKFNILFFKLYQFFIRNYKDTFSSVCQSKFCVYDPKYLKINAKSVLFDGFGQSEMYFNDISTLIKQKFIFKESLVNEKTKIILNEILSRNSISVHIRRGDYLFFGVSMKERMNYYNDAINYIKQNVIDSFFIFFSDDPQWVTEHFSLDDGLVVNWNKENDCWQDMYLMSKCKHNIIANSTFSWWGAWLNDNPNKIVITPKVWFDGENEEDIFPTSWIRI